MATNMARAGYGGGLPRSTRPSLIGLVIALGLPALAIIGSHLTAGISDRTAAIILSATPWLTLGWVVLAERRPLASIGLHGPDWRTLAFGMAGIAVNLAISLAVGTLNAALGLHETQSDLMANLLQGPGWILVLTVTNGAVLTEIAFRGYAIERLGEIARDRLWIGAVGQIAVTTCLFVVSRGFAHGLVWLIDDIVFSLFYLWRRDTLACLAAHAVPNLVASALVAMGAAR
ncbi:MAG TPA: CPBP family glutamic-type intramembrane protease [Aliidongia sp.]|nr:CPBP family glutamic-type intramembrane protease [Aliidongia sp.]